MLTMRVDAIDLENSVKKVLQWIREFRGRYICVANVHMCMESFDDSDFGAIVNRSDLVVADGMPLVWAKKLLGSRSASHVRGSDLMHGLFHTAEQQQIPVGFYGSTHECLAGLETYISHHFPKLVVNLGISPPFRPLEETEVCAHIDQINESRVKILFVGLGCPKQEQWMASHLDKVSCVMVGVGAAFDFFSGQKKTAPVWMQRSGLEWMFRFASEPKRLWKRYLNYNTRFIWCFFKQFLGYNFLHKHWE